eukprot:352473-Chlamydomonas_euryale.AAC.9
MSNSHLRLCRPRSTACHACGGKWTAETLHDELGAFLFCSSWLTLCMAMWHAYITVVQATECCEPRMP